MVLKTNLYFLGETSVFPFAEADSCKKYWQRNHADILRDTNRLGFVSWSPVSRRRDKILLWCKSVFWLPWRDGSRGILAGLATAVKETRRYPLPLLWGLPFPQQGLMSNHMWAKSEAWLNSPSAAAQSDFADFMLKLISSPSPFTWLSWGPCNLPLKGTCNEEIGSNI